MENCNFTIPSLHLAPRRDGFLKDVSSIYSVRKSLISFRQWTKEGHGLVGDFPGWCQEGHKTFCISHPSRSTGQLTNPRSPWKWPSSRSDQHALALRIRIMSLFFPRTHTGFYDCRLHDIKTTLHPFNGLFSRTTWVSRHQKGKPFWILPEQEMMGGSGIS